MQLPCKIEKPLLNVQQVVHIANFMVILSETALNIFQIEHPGDINVSVEHVKQMNLIPDSICASI